MLFGGKRSDISKRPLIPGLATRSAGFRRYYPNEGETAILSDASKWLQYDGFHWVFVPASDDSSKTSSGFWVLTPAAFDPKKKCASADELVKYLHQSFNKYSKLLNREFSAAILKNPDGTFSPSKTPLAEGFDSSDPLANMSLNYAGVPFIAEGEVAGTWHSHGDSKNENGVEEPGFLNFSNQDVLSADQVSQNALKSIPSYLSTPDGLILRYDSKLGQFRVEEPPPNEELIGDYSRSSPGITKLSPGGCSCCSN